MNWRRIAVTGIVAGMVAITGCSANMPETNQGNRNGQRVTDSVNRRADTYRTTAGRTTRGIHRAANNAASNTATPSRSFSLGRPQGRIGNTFRYGGHRGYMQGLDNYSHRGYMHGLDNYSRTGHTQGTGTNQGMAQQHGYDMGVTTSEQAIVSNRTNRSTVNNSTSTVNTSNNAAETKRAAANPTRSTTQKTETKRVDTKRKATPARTNTTTANKANKTHKATTTPARSSMPAPRLTMPRYTFNHRAASAVPTRNLNPATRNTQHPRRYTTARNTNRMTHNNRMAHNSNHITRNNNRMAYNNNRMAHNSNRMARNNNRMAYSPYRMTFENYGINNISNTPLGIVPNTEETVTVLNYEDSFTDNNMDTIGSETVFFRKKADEPTSPTVPEIPSPQNRFRQSYDDSNYDNNFNNSYDRANVPQQAAPGSNTNMPQQNSPGNRQDTPVKPPARTVSKRIAK
ncbi:MAG: hypothetical protein FWC32_11530 [Firmicutes bacterium]|nr:hypothetical protein [Bacillota bacterium]